MKQCLALLLFLLVLFTVAPAAQETPKPEENLEVVENTGAFFNGKDLTGWQGLSAYWSVRDGAIVGKTPPGGLRFNTFLCSQRPYGDFELSFKVRLTGDLRHANSGVQIRSGLFNLDTYAVLGPQCDMGQIYWGSVYGENFGGMMQASPQEKVKALLKPGDFNDYYIRVVGNHITTKLNGEIMVDRSFPLVPDVGLIAWQLHAGPAMEVVFKEIRFSTIRKKAARK